MGIWDEGQGQVLGKGDGDQEQVWGYGMGIRDRYGGQEDGGQGQMWRTDVRGTMDTWGLCISKSGAVTREANMNSSPGVKTQLLRLELRAL